MNFKKSLLDLLGKYKDSAAVKSVMQSLEGEQAPQRVECAKSGVIADGSAIETPTDWVVDAEVYTNDADGNQMPIPDGEYIIDGTTSIVVMGGKITEVSTAAEEATDTEMSAEVTQTIEALLAKISELETAQASHQTALSAITTERDSLVTERDTLKAKVVALGKAPAAQSVKEVKQNASDKKEDAPKKSFKQMTYAERVRVNLNN